MRALLDVNVLIALLDASHVSHEAAMNWFIQSGVNGWASCAITQNGCLRIMTAPAYPSARPLAVIADRLREATSHSAHEFWSDRVSVLDPETVDHSRVFGGRHVTDVYLLALAVHYGGRLVTFDRAIPRTAVIGAREQHLVVL